MIKQFTNSNVIVFLASLVVVTMPLKSSFNSISIILFISYTVFFLFIKRKEVVYIPSKKVLILIVPFLFILVQGFYSEWDSFSSNVIRSLPLIIFPFLFFYLGPWLKEREVKIVLTTFLFSSIGYSIFLLTIAFYRQILYKPDFSTINWFFFTYYDFTEALNIHPTYFGIYICLSFAVLFYHYLSRGNQNFINTLGLCFLLLIILLSGSRISVVCLILIIISTLALKLKGLNRKSKTIVLIFSIALPLIIFNYVPIVKERIIDMTFGLKETYKYAKYGVDIKYNGGLKPRFEMWKCAIDVGNRNVLFGSGFGTTQKLLNDCYFTFTPYLLQLKENTYYT